jgi:hypothetical protein
MAASLEVSVPQLKKFSLLEEHFEWKCDGSVKEVLQRKMIKELRLLEQFLLSRGKESVTSIIRVYTSDGDLHVSKSGDT